MSLHVIYDHYCSWCLSLCIVILAAIGLAGFAVERATADKRAKFPPDEGETKADSDADDLDGDQHYGQVAKGAVSSSDRP